MGQGTEEQLTRDIEARRAELSRDLDALTDKVSPSQIVDRRKEAARGRLRSVRERVMGSAQDAGRGVSSAGSSTGDAVTSTAKGAVGTIESRTEGNPLAAGLVAFGAGWLVSSLMPSSEKEARAAQQLVDTAKEHGRPIAEEAKNLGQEMSEELRDSAAQAAEQVRSSAQSSAQTVQEESRSSAQNVSEDVQNRRS